MEYKEYEKLNFDSQYKQKGYPKNLWPILNEYFSRFKYEYELSDFEINDRVERVTSNLNKIKIGYFGKNPEYDGLYSYYFKHIKINSLIYNKIPLTFVDAIFHELNHVTDISAYPVSDNGKKICYEFINYDKKTKSRSGIGLNEIVTELKCKRLFYNEKNDYLKDDEKEQKLGYHKILFIGSMLHTTLGINEREFLKNACKGREKFDEVMREKFGDDTYDNYINSMFHYADIIYSKEFSQNRYIDDRDCTNEVDKIKEICLSAIEKRMQFEKDSCKNEDELKQFAIKCKTELENLNKYYNEGMEKLNYKTVELNSNESNEILHNIFGNEFDFSSIEQNDIEKTEDIKQWDNTKLLEDIHNIDKKNYFLSEMIEKNMEYNYYTAKKIIGFVYKLKNIINIRNKKDNRISLPELKVEYEEKDNLSEKLKEQVSNEEEILKGNIAKENLEYDNKEIENNVYEK